jgi:hypothetical protein
MTSVGCGPMPPSVVQRPGFFVNSVSLNVTGILDIHRYLVNSFHHHVESMHLITLDLQIQELSKMKDRLEQSPISRVSPDTLQLMFLSEDHHPVKWISNRLAAFVTWVFVQSVYSDINSFLAQVTSIHPSHLDIRGSQATRPLYFFI